MILKLSLSGSFRLSQTLSSFSKFSSVGVKKENVKALLYYDWPSM